MKVSSKTIAAVVALPMAAVASQALAADVPMTMPTYSDPITAYASPESFWNGFYAGGHIGRGFVETNGVKREEFGAGLQAGYNYQIDQFVIGGEVEGTYSNKLDYVLPGNGVLRQTWSGAAKLRAGVALDRVLVFGTLGLGVARLDSEGRVTSPDKWATGLSFGGGAEVAFTDQLSGKLEYAQTRYNDVKSTVGGVQRSDNLVNHTIKAGLNFRF